MKRYEVTTNIWRNGVMIEAGSTIDLNDAQAKYLRHALREPQAEVAAPVVTEVAEVAPVEAPVEIEAEVQAEMQIEAPVAKPHRRRKDGAAHGDSH